MLIGGILVILVPVTSMIVNTQGGVLICFKFGLWVKFGPSVRSSGTYSWVIQFLFIWSSGFSLMYLSPLQNGWDQIIDIYIFQIPLIFRSKTIRRTLCTVVHLTWKRNRTGWRSGPRKATVTVYRTVPSLTIWFVFFSFFSCHFFTNSN